MIYCPNSTTFRNPASIQNLLNLFCCDSFSIRSPYCCNRRSWFTGSSQSRSTSVLTTLSTSEELDCPITTGLPVSLVKGFILFTYLRDCSVKTELVCRDNYAKNSLNRFQIGCIVYRQFSMSFASELTSGQWSRSTENWQMTVCGCAQYFNPADSYELIEIVQAWRRGPAQTQGIIPPIPALSMSPIILITTPPLVIRNGNTGKSHMTQPLPNSWTMGFFFGVVGWASSSS